MTTRSPLSFRFVAAALAGTAMAAPAVAAPVRAATAPGDPLPARIRPYDETVTRSIQPQAEKLLLALVKDGRKLVLDGTPVFNGADKFLPGKIAIGLTEYLLTLPKDDPRLPKYLADFRQIAKLTVDDANDSWGAYYYISALAKLRDAGLLDKAVDPLTLAKLRVRLDWRMFVDPDTMTLIDHPNNYLCVALGIARLRHKMGWDDAAWGDKLYARIADHYRRYSGPYGFADETDGEGRFDRYSVLLAGEIAARFNETGGTPPKEVLSWLRKAADVMLMRMHADGSGFEYGRSLGPYGETAIIETLTAAAANGVLTPAERDLAYAYAARAAERYVHFWTDPKTGSVNLWDNGRRTDAYRGKFRILGENLSLTHQFAYTMATWAKLGYAGRAPIADFAARLDRLPREQVTWFARGKHDRVLVTRRDRGYVIGLPLINGGESQHMNNPYYPIPYARGLIEGAADADWPLLVPRLTLADGSVLAPLAYMRDVRIESGKDRTTIRYRQDALDRLGARGPRADDRVSVETIYVLEPGRITRTDTFAPRAPVAAKELRVELGTFSTQPVQRALATRFGTGAVTGFAVTGYRGCESGVVDDPAYRSDTRAMKTRVRCTSTPSDLSAPFTVSWTLEYR